MEKGVVIRGAQVEAARHYLVDCRVCRAVYTVPRPAGFEVVEPGRLTMLAPGMVTPAGKGERVRCPVCDAENGLRAKVFVADEVLRALERKAATAYWRQCRYENPKARPVYADSLSHCNDAYYTVAHSVGAG